MLIYLCSSTLNNKHRRNVESDVLLNDFSIVMVDIYRHLGLLIDKGYNL